MMKHEGDLKKFDFRKWCSEKAVELGIDSAIDLVMPALETATGLPIGLIVDMLAGEGF